MASLGHNALKIFPRLIYLIIIKSYIVLLKPGRFSAQRVNNVVSAIMMTPPNGNIFRVNGHLCGEFSGHRWISRTKASGAELWFFSVICAWINGWVNNGEAGDLKRHRAHYDVIVMIEFYLHTILCKAHLVGSPRWVPGEGQIMCGLWTWRISALKHAECCRWAVSTNA